MGAGASTEFNPEAVSLGDAESSEPVDAEGYDSDLADDFRDLKAPRAKPAQGRPTVETSRGRLGPEPSGDAKRALPCAKKIVPPFQYPKDHPAGAEKLPDNKLRLEFVHGYRSHDARHNLHYDKKGLLVYHAAALGIVLNAKTRKQTFFDAHSDDVTCIAKHPGGDFFATGQVGDFPAIHVWRSSDAKKVCTIRSTELHKNAILCAAFSKCGKYLASVGADEAHLVAVHEWGPPGWDPLKGEATPKLIATEKFGRARPYVCAFNPVDGRLVVGGKKSLKFFTIDDGTLRVAPAQYSHGASKGFAACSVLSIAFLPDGSTFAGTMKGDAYKYEEGGCRAVRKFAAIHHGPIHDMAFTGKVLATAGKDGKIKLWSVFMQPVFEVDTAKVAEGLLDAHAQPRSYAAGKAPSIRALAPSADGRKLAYGTAASEIFEIDITDEKAAQDKTKAKLLMNGHAGAIDPKTGADRGDVWGLAMHPREPRFVTVSEDRSIRLWSLKGKTQDRMLRLPSKGRCVDWHPKTEHVAVGTYRGDVIVVDVEKGTIVTQTKLSNVRVNAVNYSPCGCFLGCASQDGVFRVLGVYAGQSGYQIVDKTDDVKPFFVIDAAHEDDRGPQAMTHVDWSEDSKFVQINTAGGDLLFFTAPQCDPVEAAFAPVRDAEWNSWTIPMGWATQGLWSEDAKPGDLNAVARSNRGDWEDGERVLACGDDYGSVKLAKYPANVGVSDAHEYRGHSAHVTNVAFSASDKWLVSTGGGDRCVMVWRHKDVDGPPDGLTPEAEAMLEDKKLTHEEKEERVLAIVHEAVGPDTDSESDEEDVVSYDQNAASSKPVMMLQTGMEHGLGVFTPVNATDGVPNPYKNHSLAELGCRRGYKSPMTGKPVLSQTHVPSWWKKDSTSYDVPTSRLKLAWAYGFRGHDARQNAWYNTKGEVCYHTAACGVVYNPASETQRLITDDPESDDVAEGNSDDVLCMTRHPERRIFATGEIGGKPKIIVWDSHDVKALAMLQGFHRTAVLCLCFSPCGDYLASVGADAEHSVAVYEWKTETLVATYKGDRNKILGINWSPFDGSLVTTGVKHVKFVKCAWKEGEKIAKGTVFRPRRATLGKKGKWQNFYACSFIDVEGKPPRTVVGCKGGQLYVFEGSTLAQVIPGAHDGKVNAVYTLHEHNVLLTGGDDGVVCFWKASDLSPLHKVRIESAATGRPAPISSLTTDAKAKALVGTKVGEIWEISDQAHLLVESHERGEIWGLAPHPSAGRAKVATGGDDGTIRIWNVKPGKKRHCVARARVIENAKPLKSGGGRYTTAAVRSLAWHPSGGQLAAGTVSGAVSLFKVDLDDPETTRIDKELDLWRPKLRTGWIADIKYSPATPDFPSGGHYIAVGSHDNVVDVYDTMRDHALVGTCKGHASFITHLGWSQDARYLWTNSGDYELMFWKMPTATQVKKGKDVQDVSWDGWTGVLGFQTTGVWYKGSDGTDVNACEVAIVPGDHGVEERVVATGDDRGIVSLFKAPALGGKPRTYGGHSSHVANVRFGPDGSQMFSAGGGDTSMLQWDVYMPAPVE